MNSGLLFANYACTCKTSVLKDSFSNPFLDFPKEIQKQIPPFSDFAVDCKSKMRVLNLNPDFPMERTLERSS